MLIVSPKPLITIENNTVFLQIHFSKSISAKEVMERKSGKRNKKFENLHIAQFEAAQRSKYDMPELTPTHYEQDNTEFIPFNSVKSKGNIENYGVHFFIDDYQFDRIWRRPLLYCKMLKKCKYVLTPDYTLYANVPIAMQIWKHYQKQWFGCYMQNAGIRTIPTLGWSDERSYEFCFEGIPAQSAVAVSSVGTQKTQKSKRLFKQGFQKAIEALKPSAILFFGQIPKDIDVAGLNIVQYPHGFDLKFKTLRNGR